MAMSSNIAKLSSAYKILWEALSILTNNWRSLLPIMLISLLFSSLLSVTIYLSISPFLTEIAACFASLSIIDPKSSQYAGIISTMRKDLREITTIEVIFIVAAFIFSSFITMTTIHIISMACSEKQQTPQELFSVIKKTWKRPMLTQLIASILNLAASFFILVLVIAFIQLSIGSLVYSVVYVFITIFAILLYLYVALVCSISIVVSVAEEGCYGLAAIERSVQLTKGRRKIGILIMFVTLVVSLVIGTVYSFSVLYASAYFFVRLVIGFGYIAMLVMINVLLCAINTVFYFECKSYGKGLLAMEGGLEYNSLSTEAGADPLKV